MSTLLHIYDTHFGSEAGEVVVALRNLAHELKPGVLVFSGDVTQRARAAQFEAARAFCDSLQIPRMLALPGNHDIPLYNLLTRVVAPWHRWNMAFNKKLEPVLDMDDAIVIGVNTTR